MDDVRHGIDQLIATLNSFEQGDDFAQQYNVKMIPLAVSQNFNQLAQQITDLFLHPNCNISQQQIYFLLLHKHKLKAIFELSDYSNTDHILKTLISEHSLTANNLASLLIVYHFNSKLDLDIWTFCKQDPSLGILAVLGLLAERRVLTKLENHNYQKFISKFETCQHWLLPDHAPPLLGQAWYQAAYDAEEHKYKVLKILNKLLTAWMTKHNITIAPKIFKHNKPRILIVLEHFKSDHAVYRCFANAIKGFKKEYYCIAVAENRELDETSKKLFDKIISVNVKLPIDIKSLASIVQRESADCCYFPSVGMKYWAIALANLKCAPVQFASAGHPISTCSTTMDFMLFEDHKYNSKNYFSEKILGLPNNHFGFVLPKFKIPQSTPSQLQQEIYIGITASAYKYNYEFLNTLKIINEKSTKKIVFCSFSPSQGLAYYQLAKKLRDVIPNFYLFPKLPYEQYLKFLSQCSLYCAPFPFGGTNSTVDCLMLGVVPIALNHPDLACADPYMLRQAGLNDLVANTPDDYIQRTLELIENNAQRNAYRQQCLDLGDDLGGILGGEDKGLIFNEIITKAVQHQAQLKREKQGFLSYQSLHKLR